MKAAILIVLLIGCTHATSAASRASMSTAASTSGIAQTAAAKTSSTAATTTVDTGPVRITTVTRDIIPATGKRPARVHVVRRIEERGTVQMVRVQAQTGTATKSTETALQATQVLKATQTSRSASTTRIGPSPLVWLAIAGGGLAAGLLLWKFRKTILPLLRIG